MPGPTRPHNRPGLTRRGHLMEQIIRHNRGKYFRYIRNHGGRKPSFRVVRKWGRKPR